MSDPNTKSDDKPVSAEVCAGCGLPVGYDAGECAARFDGDEVYNCDQRLIAKLRAEVEALRARVREQASQPGPLWLQSITCPKCGDEFESHETEYDGDQRDEECSGCGTQFDVFASVDISYRCTAAKKG